ncbi:hypothetical protein CAPTEDRAFT_119690 [Capitella teleta]|uniref:BTB domain-containing protein n=1 Tax=Capitella teleta TaxID=283909 RepID=R7VBT1_CAPTE|nr:hypothetical protein CAPTEDRAFT_119690 [Capitella teleta]|eukprot:ELU13145.1 hypothetical protein CAPTEDRAFT_119690 [Capitella teleta]
MAGNEFLQEMSATLRDMRHSDEMVDVVLVFEETRVKCHRLVLAASSEYFRRMLQTDMQERDASEIAFKEVSSTIGLLLVEYLYTGNIELSTENAQELLAVSDRLLLMKLKKTVEKFLCDQVSITNCVSLKQLARLYDLDTLLKTAHDYLNDHWKDLVAIDFESEIDQLTEDDLIELLTTHSSDEGSFLLLQKWVRSSEGRTHLFMDLLQNLELTQFSKSFVWRTIMSDELMQNPKGMRFIQEAMEPFMTFDRDHVTSSSSDGFIVSGGLDRPVLNNKCYGYVAHTRQWRTLPPMNIGRYYHATICDQDQFMVIGGRISETYFLDSVECLNLKTLRWSQFPDLPRALSLSNVVYVKGQLFVLGGWASKSVISRDVYAFDSTGGTWWFKGLMPEESRVGSAVSLNDKIFVLGGEFRVCMQYDPCTDLWVELQRPLYQHAFGPAVVWQDKIVLCGGRQTNAIEEYDPQSDTWSTWDLKIPAYNNIDICFALKIKRYT